MVKHQHLLKLETRLVILHQNQEFLLACKLRLFRIIRLAKKAEKVQRILSDISLSPLGS